MVKMYEDSVELPGPNVVCLHMYVMCKCDVYYYYYMLCVNLMCIIIIIIM